MLRQTTGWTGLRRCVCDHYRGGPAEGNTFNIQTHPAQARRRFWWVCWDGHRKHTAWTGTVCSLLALLFTDLMTSGLRAQVCIGLYLFSHILQHLEGRHKRGQMDHGWLLPSSVLACCRFLHPAPAPVTVNGFPVLIKLMKYPHN